MRVMVVHPGADCSVSDVHDGLITGLRQNGAHVESLNLNDRLFFYIHCHTQGRDGKLKKAFDAAQALHLVTREVITDAYCYWPDVIVFVSGFNIDPNLLPLLRSRGHHLVGWFTEAPYEDDKQLDVADLFDTVIVNDDSTIDRYREINPRTWYLPHSYDPRRHRPGRPAKDWRSDFCWVGTGFPSRVEFFEKVDTLGGFDGIDVHLGGSWQFVDDSPIYRFVRNPYGRKWMLNNETARCYRGAKMSANLYRKETSAGGTNDGRAISPREIEMAACGLFYIRESHGEGDEVFSMLPTFTSPEEFAELVAWWVRHNDQRDEVARAARAAVADRTFRNTTARLLRLIDEVPKAVAA